MFRWWANFNRRQPLSNVRGSDALSEPRTSESGCFMTGTKHCLLPLLCAAAVCAQPAPVFRTDVNLVRVVATVKNQAGELVGALQKGDFAVSDNGARQEIAVFDR